MQIIHITNEPSRKIVTFRLLDDGVVADAHIVFSGLGGAYLETETSLNHEQAEKLVKLAKIHKPQDFVRVMGGFIFRTYGKVSSLNGHIGVEVRAAVDDGNEVISYQQATGVEGEFFTVYTQDTGGWWCAAGDFKTAQEAHDREAELWFAAENPSEDCPWGIDFLVALSITESGNTRAEKRIVRATCSRQAARKAILAAYADDEKNFALQKEPLSHGVAWFGETLQAHLVEIMYDAASVREISSEHAEVLRQYL